MAVVSILTLLPFSSTSVSPVLVAVEAAEGDGVAGDRLAAFGGLLAEQREEAGDALLVRPAIDGGAVGKAAGQHARERQLAAMRGVEGLGDEGRRRLLVDAEPLSCGFDERDFVPQRLEQAEDAVARLRRAEQHRADQPVAQLLGEIVEHLVARRRHVFEQLLHQLVVVIGQLLQHGEARFLLMRGERIGNCHDLARRMLAIDVSALQREIDEAGDDVVLPDGDLAQHQRLGARRLQHRHDVAHPRLGLVDLVDEEEMRNAAILELLEDELQRRHLLLVRLAHHHRGVAGGERIRRVGLEFDRAWAIEEGEAVAEKIDGGDVELDAHAVMARLRRGIAHRIAVGHRPLAGDGAGARQYGFEKCRFSAEIGANQCDAAGAAGWLALRVAHDLLPCGYDAARKAPDAPPAQALMTTW